MFLCLGKSCLDLGQVTERFTMSDGPVILLPLRTEASIRARAIHGDKHRSASRIFYVSCVQPFLSILIGLVIKPTSCIM